VKTTAQINKSETPTKPKQPPAYPLVSVVVPVLNGERVLGKCLEALTHQDWCPDPASSAGLEIIVIDDGSTDGTKQVAKSYPVTYIYQEHLGPAAARNLGTQHASGDILLFTDADCVPSLNWVSQMVRPMLDDPEVVGVKGRYETKQRALVPRMIQLEFEERYRKLESHHQIDFVDSYSAALKKSVFQSVGGFDQEFPQANNEDVDLSFRIAATGGKMVFNPDAIVNHTHPTRMLGYFRLKFGRAFWRMLVYKKHPKKAVRDSYTPQTLKLQILFGWAMLLAFLEWLIFPKEALIPLLVCLVGFALSCLPFWASGIRRDPVMTLLSPPLLFIRAICFGVGVFLGVVFLDRKSSWIRAGLIFSDIFLCVAALGAAYFIRITWIPRPEYYVFPLKVYLPLAIFPSLVLVIANWQQGLYQVLSTHSDFHQNTRIIKAHLVMALTIMAGFYLAKIDYSRATLLLFLGLSVLFITNSRWALRKIWSVVVKHGINQSRVLIVGVGETSQLLLEKLRKFPELGYRVVGLIAENGASKSAGDVRGIPVLGGYQDIPSVVHDKHIHEVIIADPLVSRQKTLELIVRIGQLNLPVKIVSDLYEIITTRTELNGFADIPVIEIPPPRTRKLNAAVKNSVEYFLAILMFLISLPFWILICAAIRFTSKGSALFRQERVGKDGKIFRIFKFRTMYRDVPNYQEAPRVRNDPRITKIGRLLRRTSLDELPQLLNVLKGEMSLVGPRPEMPFIVSQYNEWQRIRLSIKPGLTGLWQILGRKDLYLHENLEYDFFYIKNQSILLDLIILLKTIPAVVKGKGAY
jgi:exopolysaccharide biosynthesis polyprenyl glycosylphosphotransferase